MNDLDLNRETEKKNTKKQTNFCSWLGLFTSWKFNIKKSNNYRDGNPRGLNLLFSTKNEPKIIGFGISWILDISWNHDFN